MDSEWVERALRGAYAAGQLAVHYGAGAGGETRTRDVEATLRKMELRVRELQRLVPGEGGESWHH